MPDSKKVEGRANDYLCDNCGTGMSEEEIVDEGGKMVWDIKDLHERVDPGGTFPAAECPECGAFMYPKEPETWKCFHCNEVFTGYAASEAHFGQTSEATTLCVLKKCLCNECPATPLECGGRTGRRVLPGSEESPDGT